MFSKEEYIRYSRHLNLPGFDLSTQEKLKQSKVLVIGAGGLGAPVLLYLAAAGVGHIGIVDFDKVDLSNLQRQILYRVADINLSKATTAGDVLGQLNPDINIQVHDVRLDNSNARSILSQYDIVADGSDNFPTRYLVNDACFLEQKINVYASIFRFEGQVSVFNYPLTDGSRGANYRDLFPVPPPHGSIPDCAAGGVWGVLPGVIGCLQATEVLKIITGMGTPLVGEMLIYDALQTSFRKIRFEKKTSASISELINYEQFCGIVANNNKTPMSQIKEITVHDLKQWKESKKDFQLIDVREQHEWDFVNIDGDLIPMGDLMSNTERISTEKEVVFLCRTGKRSGVAVDILQKQGFDNLYNLKGGITAWAKEIDKSLPTY